MKSMLQMTAVVAAVVFAGLLGVAVAQPYNNSGYPYNSLPECSTFTAPEDIFVGGACTWVCKPKQVGLDEVWDSIGTANSCATVYDRKATYTTIMDQACKRTVGGVKELCVSAKMAAMTINEINYECAGTRVGDLLPHIQKSGMLTGCATSASRRRRQVVAPSVRTNVTDTPAVEPAARQLELCVTAAFNSHVTLDPADLTAGTNNCQRLCIHYLCIQGPFTAACFNQRHATHYAEEIQYQILGPGHPDVQACFQNYDNGL